MSKPKHGDQTKNGVWLDESAYQKPLADPRQGMHLPDCDASPCDYSHIDALTSDNPIELTYNAEYGLWLCPTHWAEIEAEAQPCQAHPEIVKIDNGHWQVRMTDGDIISNHSDRQGAQRMIKRMKGVNHDPVSTTTPAL